MTVSLQEQDKQNVQSAMGILTPKNKIFKRFILKPSLQFAQLNASNWLSNSPNKHRQRNMKTHLTRNLLPEYESFSAHSLLGLQTVSSKKWELFLTLMTALQYLLSPTNYMNTIKKRVSLTTKVRLILHWANWSKPPQLIPVSDA